MKPPIRFAHRNLVFGESDRDVWGVYRLEMESYEGLSDSEKIELVAATVSWLGHTRADVSGLRVSRAWSVDDYASRARAGLDRHHGHAEEWASYLAADEHRLRGREIVRPELYVSVRLAPPRPAPVDIVAAGLGSLLATPRRAWRHASRVGGIGDPRALSERRLAHLDQAEHRVYNQLSGFFEAERTTALDLQWLIRRGFCRGLGEPAIDVHWRPQALAVLEGDEVVYKPLEVDVMRLFDSVIHREDRRLRIESELGTSYQAMLVLGALPESAIFPGEEAELLFAPLEALGFPVDACFNAEFVPNDRAVALVRRKVVDADHIYAEESHGDHGPSFEGSKRPHLARELEDYLRGDGRPPLAKVTVSLAIGADSPEELSRRLDALQTHYGTITLHQPLGLPQLELFCQHFPGQPTKLPDYADYMALEQLAAMAPIATHSVGSDRGAYIAHTLSGSEQPVMFDVTEASRRSRPPAVLTVGTLGSGKTMFLQLLMYLAYLRGSSVVDVDPKGDHEWHRLPGLEGPEGPRYEVIELRDARRYRGMLDPLRIADEYLCEDLATSFLIDVLPAGIPHTWRTEIRRAVKTVVTRAGADGTARHCCDVLTVLGAGSEVAVEVARALEVYADSGLAQLGFAVRDFNAPPVGDKPVTILRIRDLPRPRRGTPADQLTEQQRIGMAVLRLLAAYTMHVMGGSRSRHKVAGFDESWFLTEDAAGRALLSNLCRWGRSENATPILASHLISDSEELDNLIGTRFVFGMENEDEITAALRILRLDTENERLRRRLAKGQPGRCLMRDLDGRVAALQIDPPKHLLAALNTTPGEGMDTLPPPPGGSTTPAPAEGTR